MNKYYIKNRSTFLVKAVQKEYKFVSPKKKVDNFKTFFDFDLYKEADFVFISSDFNWRAIREERNYRCKCRVRNIGNNKEYNAELKVERIIRYSYEQYLLENAGNITLKGKVEVSFFSEQYKIDIFFFQNELPLEADPNLNYYDDEDHSVWDDYDYEKDVFDALTDGQYGDYNEWDNNWDRLDDWRGG